MSSGYIDNSGIWVWDGSDDEREYGPEESCSHHCGYVSSGQDLIDHERYEHRPCPECGAGPGQDLEIYGLTHKLDCPRLRPGYVYPEASR